MNKEKTIKQVKKCGANIGNALIKGVAKTASFIEKYDKEISIGAVVSAAGIAGFNMIAKLAKDDYANKVAGTVSKVLITATCITVGIKGTNNISKKIIR